MSDLNRALPHLERLRRIGSQLNSDGNYDIGNQIIDIADAVMDVIADVITNTTRYSDDRPLDAKSEAAPGAHGAYR